MIYSDKTHIVSKSINQYGEHVHIIRILTKEGRTGLAVGTPIISNVKLNNQEVYDRQ